MERSVIFDSILKSIVAGIRLLCCMGNPCPLLQYTWPSYDNKEQMLRKSERRRKHSYILNVGSLRFSSLFVGNMFAVFLLCSQRTEEIGSSQVAYGSMNGVNPWLMLHRPFMLLSSFISRHLIDEIILL
ncbi:uncharacterized protein LOC107859328 [Capsicum annuum]|uniref:uncharacterized protein LOC107859328 n=1 Tax=Capsicum annuum TaxID=4072 RepID=UPI001FB065C2|nr:uncharacterized protein LOC107859328 [Capsicum annuum]XP_047262859.1 uncharacterized protein LOC107859328 [Capsicum annuum]XP_047262860.1 uncharacterized protein LOC107859328 [Capsicum annuum]